MANRGNSRADENRKIRQEAIREQLSNKQLLEQVVKIAEKLEDLEGEKKADNANLDALKVSRLRHAADLKLKLVNKYLPDLKAVEMDLDTTGPIQVAVIKLSDVENTPPQ